MKLSELILSVKSVKMGRHTFYSVLDFEQKLRTAPEVGFYEYIIFSPFYIDVCMFELYEYECAIVPVFRHEDMDQYCIKRTQANKIEDIEPAIVKRLKLCYIPTLESDPKSSQYRKQLLDYFDTLLNSEEIRARVAQVNKFSGFEKKNLFLEVI